MGQCHSKSKGPTPQKCLRFSVWEPGSRDDDGYFKNAGHWQWPKCHCGGYANASDPHWWLDKHNPDGPNHVNETADDGTSINLESRSDTGLHPHLLLVPKSSQGPAYNNPTAETLKLHSRSEADAREPTLPSFRFSEVAIGIFDGLCCLLIVFLVLLFVRMKVQRRRELAMQLARERVGRNATVKKVVGNAQVDPPSWRAQDGC